MGCASAANLPLVGKVFSERGAREQIHISQSCAALGPRRKMARSFSAYSIHPGDNRKGNNLKVPR